MYKKEWDRLKDLLRIHEFKRLADNDLVTNLSGWKQVTAIVPESQKMQEIISDLMEENATKS